MPAPNPRSEALHLADDLLRVNEVYGRDCHNFVVRQLRLAPHIGWRDVIDLALTEWHTTRSPHATQVLI